MDSLNLRDTVGFNASVMKLHALIQDTLGLLNALQKRLKSIPDEMQKACNAVYILQFIVLGIRHDFFQLDEQSVAPDFLDSWRDTITILESSIQTFRNHFIQDFGFEFENINRRELRHKADLFFANKDVVRSQHSLSGTIVQLALLRELAIRFQCRSLLPLTQFYPEMLDEIKGQLELDSQVSLQAILGARPEYAEPRQRQIVKYNIPTTSSRSYAKWSSGLSNGGLLLSLRGYSPTAKQSIAQHTCFLPIGTLHYERSHEKRSNPNSYVSDTDEQDDLYSFSFAFDPIPWLSKFWVQMGFELCKKSHQSWCLSFRLGDPTPGGVWNENTLDLWDISRLRERLQQGRISPNDLVCDEYLGTVSVLHLAVFQAKSSYFYSLDEIYQVCKILIDHGATVKNKDFEVGSPLYTLLDTSSRIYECPKFTTFGHYDRSQEVVGGVKAIAQLLLSHQASFDCVPAYGDHRTRWSDAHGWLPRLLNLSNNPEDLYEIFFEKVDESDIEEFCLTDRWLVAILCAAYPRLRAAFLSPICRSYNKGISPLPHQIELSTVLEEVKAASSVDRKLLISCICRVGTSAMLRPFLEGDFDLNEYSGRHTPGVVNGLWERFSGHQYDENYEQSYFLQAANEINLDIISALVKAGVKITERNPFGKFFCRGRNRKCQKYDTVPFIELVLEALNVERLKGKHLLLYSVFSKRNHGTDWRFNDLTLAVSCVLDGLIQRGCVLTPPLAHMENKLIPEIFQAIRLESSIYCWSDEINFVRLSLMHILKKYKPNLESTKMVYNFYGRGITARITALGLAVERLELEIVHMFLEAGANIENPITGGLSALEIAKMNFRISQEGRFVPKYLEEGPGTEEKVFEMIIRFLRDRGIHSIAEEAISEVNEYRSLEPTSLLPPSLRMTLDYVKGSEASSKKETRFRKAIGENISNFKAITSVNIDGSLIRFGFLLSLSIALGFEGWAALSNSIRTWKRMIVAKHVALILLILIFALKFEYITY